MRYAMLVACAASVLAAGITADAPATSSISTPSSDRALVEALLYHRSDVPDHWLRPRREAALPFPCTSNNQPESNPETRLGAGWVEAGNTLIRRVMWSSAETTSAPDKLFRARVAEFTKCIKGKRAASQPGRLVSAPARVKITSFYATEAKPSGDLGFELMVVRVGTAVAQYVYRWVKPPYRESGRALVVRAVTRGVRTIG